MRKDYNNEQTGKPCTNVFYHILPTMRPETEPYFECEFSWQLSGLEKAAILAFPILCYWL